MAWLLAHLAPLMFIALVLVLMSGVPVFLGLVACGLSFALLGIYLGVMPAALLQALPLRLIGIMKNEMLLAIPFFTLMGLIFDRCGLAADLLETIGEVFGPVRGGLAFAVVLVGTLLGATTGVVAASVISMGLFSLPLMLRNGYDPRWASGVIAASGSLTQIVPPSLVLIVLADQLNRSVGDMYAAALVPSVIVISGYLLVVTLVAWRRPAAMPALPPRVDAQSLIAGTSGLRSLAVLALFGAVASALFMQAYPDLLVLTGRDFVAPPTDELVMVSLGSGVTFAFALALADRWLGLCWLSPLAQRVAFVLVPPVMLIFLVLGTIYLGVATPTEGGAMGAVGAMLVAVARRGLSLNRLLEAALTCIKLSCFVIFILIGSSIFSLSFNALEGTQWVAALFDTLPGGASGMLAFVTALVFFLGFFLDFFEIAFILVPLLAPVAQKLGIDLVWFGILLGVNLQTSFLTPPFGYALFFLRGVAPAHDHVDNASGRMVPGVSTGDIYRGVLPFIAVQVLTIAVLIAFPQIVSVGERNAPIMSESAVVELLRRSAGDASALPVQDPVQLLEQAMARETKPR